MNRQRAAHGVKPLVRDDTLSETALKCATYRAERGIQGHTSNDFDFLPDRNYRLATATGCAAWRDGFGACGILESKYTVAGAAVVVGKNGLRYCHVYYR